MDLRYSSRHRALQEDARSFIKEYGHLSPKTGGGRKRPDARALDWQELLLERGYFARNIPREYGGFGLPVDIMELAIIAEEFSIAGVSPGIMNQGISMLVPTLLEVGTKEQCIRWIGPTIRGDWETKPQIRGRPKTGAQSGNTSIELENCPAKW